MSYPRTSALLIALAGVVPSSLISAQKLTADRIFDPTHLVDVKIEIDAADWDALRHQTRSFVTALTKEPSKRPYTWFKGSVTIDGVRIEDVGIRKKGFIGSLDSTRPSLKIKFAEFREQTPSKGFDRLTLNNNKQDPSQLSQYLSYKLFRAAGNPASRCNHAKVTINGTPLGIYSNVESIKAPMLSREFGDSSGALFEGTVTDFFADALVKFEPKTKNADTKSLGPVAAVCTAATLELDALGKHLDIDAFLRFWATESLIGFWDGYTNNQNNFFLYRKPSNQKLYFLPWGTDSSFVSRMPIAPFIIKTKSAHSQSLLSNRLYQMPEIQERYRKTLTDVIERVWDEDALYRDIDRVETLLRDHLHANQNGFERSVRSMRAFIKTRRKVMNRELNRWPLKLKDGPRRPFYFEQIGSATGTFHTKWNERAPANPVANGKAKLRLTLDGKLVEFEQVGVSAERSTWPTLDGGPKPPSIVFTGKRESDGKVFILGFSIAIDDFKPSGAQSVTVMGALIEGRFGFLNPKNIRMMSGRAKLTAANAEPGADVRGEVELEIAKMAGGETDRFKPK